MLFAHLKSKLLELSFPISKLRAISSVKKIKALPVKQNKDGGYQIKLLGKGNDVRVYFSSNSNTLKSIVIIQGDMRSELSHITLVTEKILNLEIGNKNSSSFDLR